MPPFGRRVSFLINSLSFTEEEGGKKKRKKKGEKKEKRKRETRIWILSFPQRRERKEQKKKKRGREEGWGMDAHRACDFLPPLFRKKGIGKEERKGKKKKEKRGGEEERTSFGLLSKRIVFHLLRKERKGEKGEKGR